MGDETDSSNDTDGLLPSDKSFWEDAFLSVLPTAMVVQGWTYGGKSITNGENRTGLAALWADYAVKEHHKRFGSTTKEGENNE